MIMASIYTDVFVEAKNSKIYKVMLFRESFL